MRATYEARKYNDTRVRHRVGGFSVDNDAELAPFVMGATYSIDTFALGTTEGLDYPTMGYKRIVASVEALIGLLFSG